MATIIQNNKTIYFLFDFFWAIVLFPKPVQLVVLLGFMLYFMNVKLIISKDKFALTQLIVLGIYAISIIFNAIISFHELTRVLAAVNTILITFTAINLYIFFSTVQIDTSRVGKSFLFNTGVLLLFLLIYLFYPAKESLTIMGYSVSAIDYIKASGTRFVGFFAYSNLIPLFSIVSIPFITDYFNKREIYSFGIIVLNFIFSYFANSRSGQIIMLFITAFFVYDYLKLKVKKGIRKLYVLIAVTIIAILGLVAFPYILAKINYMFSSRAASNSMRFAIYQNSIEKMIDNNPIIGMGIKDLYGDSIYPYGSHSTYIGYFYKTGILGGCLYIQSIIIYLCRITKWKKRTLTDFVYFISAIALFFWMVLEDLDGTNWSICYAYTILGIIRSRSQYYIILQVKTQ